MEIVALPRYTKAVKKLLTGAERLAMESAIAADPLQFPIIPATGGFRKARWKRGTHGKSGGVRAIFYFYVVGQTVYLIDLYAKNQKENLTNDEEKHLRKVAAEIERQKG